MYTHSQANELGGPHVDLELSGKHVMITGASGGIGLTVTKMFLEEGARVTGVYNTSKEALGRLAEDWPESFIAMKADQTKELEVSRSFESARAAFGRVDVLVANAGIANHEGIAVHEMTLEQWERTIRVNLTGTFLFAKHFFANLEATKGDSASLILIGSTAGFFGEAWYSDYSTSKAGLQGLLYSLKNEIVHLARHGRVNLVNPGWTLTPMAEDALKDRDMVQRILQTVPERKTAVPEDIAGAILYLASDRLAGHVSGQIINVAGGMEGRVLFTRDEVGV
jgi:NAD(P)-dependent dehydrogenase (short-subunit alcohol dehydrogenase family)